MKTLNCSTDGDFECTLENRVEKDEGRDTLIESVQAMQGKKVIATLYNCPKCGTTRALIENL